jgi:hypothetical protein
MSAAPSYTAEKAATQAPPSETTLLELVRAIGEVTDDEGEVVATVMQMLDSGRVRLCGNFRGAPIDDLR